MCCTGRCRYEDYMGDCKVKAGTPWPTDAHCNDVYQDEENTDERIPCFELCGDFEK